LPAYVQREFYDYLRCGMLAHGFLRLGCDTCHKELLLPFSCKRRGFCPSCAGRRMAQTAAHLVEQVIPWVATRQWVVSVPIPLRYWMAASRNLTAQVHTIIRTTIGQYYVNQAGKRGIERATVYPGSVTFIQRFGSAINLNLHFHCVFMEGVYLDRTEAGLKPRFLQGEPPTDTDIADVIQKISRRVIRKLRHLGYLEAGLDPVVATGFDPLVDAQPELARTMAASVQQRIAFGERAGQNVRRIGSGFGHEGERPTPKSPHTGAISWNACSGILPAVPYPWSASRQRPTAISFIPSPIRGPMAPRGFGSRRWNSWRSWPPSYPCHASIWCAMGAASRRTATCVGRSVPPRANRGWTGRRRTRAPRTGLGPGCWAASLVWRWPRVPGADGAHCGSLPSSPRSR
jgi:Transposase zinc-binding domain/Putative transposase